MMNDERSVFTNDILFSAILEEKLLIREWSAKPSLKVLYFECNVFGKRISLLSSGKFAELRPNIILMTCFVFVRM